MNETDINIRQWMKDMEEKISDKFSLFFHLDLSEYEVQEENFISAVLQSSPEWYIVGDEYIVSKADGVYLTPYKRRSAYVVCDTFTATIRKDHMNQDLQLAQDRLYEYALDLKTFFNRVPSSIFHLEKRKHEAYIAGQMLNEALIERFEDAHVDVSLDISPLDAIRHTYATVTRATYLITIRGRTVIRKYSHPKDSMKIYKHIMKAIENISFDN